MPGTDLIADWASDTESILKPERDLVHEAGVVASGQPFGLGRDRAERRVEHEREVAGLRREIATGSIRVRAAGRFADPEDAVHMLDLDALLAEADDRKRAEAVDAALDELLKAKPYLAREKERGPLVTQGGRSTPPERRARERSWLRG